MHFLQGFGDPEGHASINIGLLPGVQRNPAPSALGSTSAQRLCLLQARPAMDQVALALFLSPPVQCRSPDPLSQAQWLPVLLQPLAVSQRGTF